MLVTLIRDRDTYVDGRVISGGRGGPLRSPI